MRTEKRENQLVSESNSHATEKILTENRDPEMRAGKLTLQTSPVRAPDLEAKELVGSLKL